MSFSQIKKKRQKIREKDQKIEEFHQFLDLRPVVFLCREYTFTPKQKLFENPGPELYHWADVFDETENYVEKNPISGSPPKDVSINF